MSNYIRKLYLQSLSGLKLFSFAKIVKISFSTKLGILFKVTNSLNKFFPDLCWGNSYSLNPFIPALADECPSKSPRALLQSLSTLTPIYQHLNEVISWINFSLVGSLSAESLTFSQLELASTCFTTKCIWRRVWTCSIINNVVYFFNNKIAYEPFLRFISKRVKLEIFWLPGHLLTERVVSKTHTYRRTLLVLMVVFRAQNWDLLTREPSHTRICPIKKVLILSAELKLFINQKQQ